MKVTFAVCVNLEEKDRDVMNFVLNPQLHWEIHWQSSCFMSEKSSKSSESSVMVSRVTMLASEAVSSMFTFSTTSKGVEVEELVELHLERRLLLVS